MDGTATVPIYSIAEGGRDEGLDGGIWRPSWASLGEELARLGPQGLNQAGDQLVRLLRENGVTYNHYGDGDEHVRPWNLDAVPFILAAQEWRELAVGLIQRAEILERVLADCYGPNRLLAEHLLPPAAVFGHPGFLRPLHGVTPVGGRWLHIYAADLVRDTTGRWLVLADRTQVPAGAGYCLENRVVLSRTLAGPFQRLDVERLANYFLTLRRLLTELAPMHRDNPRIALLTPGPRSTTYFEHAYLARYLGITLVEGADLTVRDDRVFLKTLTGLAPIDVILRRLDDDACDPLELRSGSLLGVPGLVRAVRAGTVAVVNALGSGLGENGALLPLMGTLCRHLLDQDLKLPSAECWSGSEAVCDRLAAGDDLVLRPIGGSGAPIFTRGMDQTQRRDLAQRVRALGQVWLAQRHLPLATAPTWRDGHLIPRTVALRAFAVHDGTAWRVMPGGLCRVADELDHAVVSMQRGGGSKDCWVLSDGPVEEVSLLPSPTTALTLKRGGIDLPSRVADNLFWMGRYCERVEGLARILRAAWQRVDEDEDPQTLRQNRVLEECLRRVTSLGTTAIDRPMLVRLVGDRSLAASLLGTMPRLQEAAFAVRDRISNDLWRVIVALHGDLSDAGRAKTSDTGRILTLLDRVVLATAAIAGMGSENTTRGPAWRFLDLGRRLERATMVIEILRGSVGGTTEDRDLDVVLETCDSALTYRSRYLSVLQAPAVLDLLLTDATNPRSVAFQLHAVLEHVTNLPRDIESALPSQPERLAIGAQTWMRLLDPTVVCRRDGSGDRPELQHILDHLASDLSVLSDALASHYFSHAAASRNLSGG